MFDRAPAYLATLPNFLIYFAASLALTAVFLLVYTRVTPYREWALIRAGNNAAAVSLSGAALGFILPLASTITHSVSWLDMVVWAVVAMIVQLATYLLARLLKPELPEAIAAGTTAPAISLAAMSVGVGILNAACLSW
jgi:putative membrane protein